MSTNSPYIDYICIINVDVATLPFAADNERHQSAVQRCAGPTVWKAWYEDTRLAVRGGWQDRNKRGHTFMTSYSSSLPIVVVPYATKTPPGNEPIR